MASVRNLTPKNEPDKQSINTSTNQSLCTCVQALATDNAALLRKVKSLEVQQADKAKSHEEQLQGQQAALRQFREQSISDKTSIQVSLLLGLHCLIGFMFGHSATHISSCTGLLC